MNDIALRVENLTKEYRLGVIGHGTLYRDLQSAWAKMRGKEDPNSLITSSHNANSEKSQFLALDNLNFEIKKGDRVGIIGNNGAGKSTLLKILSRITTPTKGKIFIDGRIGSLLEVGTGFHPELTGRENIFLNGAILGMKKSEISTKIDNIIKLSGIRKFIDTPVKRYSSGMRVRLGFSVAIHLEPEILIIDEVLAVGDAEFQRKAIEKMDEISRTDGRTILFVSHNMNSIKKLCSKCIVLDTGTVSYFGKTGKAIDYYLEAQDKSTKLNIIDRKDRTGSGRIRLDKIEIQDKKGLATKTIFSGNDLSIHLEFSGEIDKTKKNELIMVLVDNMGNRLARISNVYKNSFFSKKMIVNIEKFPFVSGNYAIHLLVKEENNLADQIMYALKFNVINDDFYDCGILPKEGFGNFLLNYSFSGTDN